MGVQLVSVFRAIQLKGAEEEEKEEWRPNGVCTAVVDYQLGTKYHAEGHWMSSALKDSLFVWCLFVCLNPLLLHYLVQDPQVSGTTASQPSFWAHLASTPIHSVSTAFPPSSQKQAEKVQILFLHFYEKGWIIFIFINYFPFFKKISHLMSYVSKWLKLCIFQKVPSGAIREPRLEGVFSVSSFRIQPQNPDNIPRGWEGGGCHQDGWKETHTPSPLWGCFPN